jgi:hypothetical protein
MSPAVVSTVKATALMRDAEPIARLTVNSLRNAPLQPSNTSSTSQGKEDLDDVAKYMNGKVVAIDLSIWIFEVCNICMTYAKCT